MQSARQRAAGARLSAEMNQLKLAFEMYKTDKGQYPFEENNISQRDELPLTEILNNISSGKGLFNELVENGYISKISDLSTPNNGQEYGYYTGGSSLLYPCNGVAFEGFLFHVYNTEVISNHNTLDNYPEWYCIGG